MTDSRHSGPSGRARHWPGTSSLVIPVPSLEGWVRSRSEHYDPAYVSADPTFAHAHLTLLSPFVARAAVTAEVCEHVRETLSRHRPFSLRLRRIDVFPDGIVYLAPEPDAPLRRITADLAARFPAYPPYAGRVRDVRPHLTLDRLGPGVDVNSVRASLGALVPAETRATEARLSWYEQDDCTTLASWPLGG